MPVRTVVSSTALIVGCMNEGLYEDAEEIFNTMDEKDVVVYNAMVEGYSKTEETAESSMEVFKSMHRARFRPTVSTFVSVLGACSLLSSPEIGEQVHCQVIKSSLSSDIKAGSALLDMYSKCGRVDDGRRIFDRMAERNVITWTSMIDGYGKNGLSDEALQLFEQMLRRRRRRHDDAIRPNHATFLSALSACARAGLLSRGQEVFQSMEREHALRPRMEHYACMVDLLGRFGSVRRAHDFIRGIPARPNSDVWAALLGAATLHGDVDMANVAARELSDSAQPTSLPPVVKWRSSMSTRHGITKVVPINEEAHASSVSLVLGQRCFVDNDLFEHSVMMRCDPLSLEGAIDPDQGFPALLTRGSGHPYIRPPPHSFAPTSPILISSPVHTLTSRGCGSDATMYHTARPKGI
ncbi:hypothetical protein OsI_11738 [Oryza sativa Indica Group]|uniref:Pentatricopeptide repeat-containing protein n=1 Tax=Oryza sativa subsp. indica TaxID=39946 RepID=A2XH63_ORYSI|nr:hypothetical protein OsI_11738 [Oryza sativa Indica Group]